MALALAAFLARLVTWDELVQAAVEAPAAAIAPDPARLSDDALREAAREADCATATELWWALVERAGEDAEAWRAIAVCSRSAGIERVIDETARVFEESRVLGVVPAVLDDLQIREVVPILNQVKTREQKGVRDYLFIGRSLLRMGDLAGALEAMESAVSLAPDDPDVRMELGIFLLKQGRIDDARYALREAFARVGPRERVARLFAFSVAWPGTFLMLVYSVLCLGFTFATQRRWDLLEALEQATGISHRFALQALGGAAAVVGVALGLSFWNLASAPAFGILGATAAGAGLWVLFSPLREPVTAGVQRLGRLISAVFRGRIYKALSNLRPGQQVAVLLLTVASLIFLVPLVPEMDLRLMLLALLGILLFSTVGTLLLGMLEQAGSLRNTLRWLAIAGTLPFLLFFLNVERERLASAGLGGELLSHLVAYALVWGLGVGFALLLSRILSVSILAPLGSILDTVEAVRGGAFEARTGVRRRDEIGGLAEAVDHMAEGLAQRERIKQTFRRYVDARVAERLIEGDAAMDRGRRLHATVLFSDVRGFTTMSEGLEPEEVVALLNEYLAMVAPVITRWGGVIDKFIGDAVMAVWEVPEPIREGPLAGVPAERLAVTAALEMFEALEAFNRGLSERGLAPIAVGIGVNAGEVLAGPLGSPDRQEYTVIGDVVNTAQRLEGAARGEDRLLVGEAVAGAIQGQFVLEERPPMALKGKRQRVRAWRVLGRVDSGG